MRHKAFLKHGKAHVISSRVITLGRFPSFELEIAGTDSLCQHSHRLSASSTRQESRAGSLAQGQCRGAGLRSRGFHGPQNLASRKGSQSAGRTEESCRARRRTSSLAPRVQRAPHAPLEGGRDGIPAPTPAWLLHSRPCVSLPSRPRYSFRPPPRASLSGCGASCSHL